MRYSAQIKKTERKNGALESSIAALKTVRDEAQAILQRGVSATNKPLTAKERQELEDSLKDCNERIKSLES